MGKLAGRGVLVTGASRGIGAAVARRLATEGARVVAHYQRNAEAAGAVVGAIREGGGWAEAAAADVSDTGQVEALVEYAARRLAVDGGRLDVLVSNAGLIEPGRLADLDEGRFDRQFSANVKSVLFGARAAARAFGDDGGAIVNVSSVNGRAPAPGAAIYSATKAAVEAITVALAMELGPRGVRVNAVAPGTTATDMLRSVLPTELEASVTSRTALGCLGTPDDIACVIAFLASGGAHIPTRFLVDPRRPSLLFESLVSSPVPRRVLDASTAPLSRGRTSSNRVCLRKGATRVVPALNGAMGGSPGRTRPAAACDRGVLPRGER